MLRVLPKKFHIANFFLLIFCSGFSALSWEVIWQLKTSIALGISTWSTALTLIIVMGGMGLGGLLIGRYTAGKEYLSALRLYGFLEIIIGIAGLVINPAFYVLEKLDRLAYQITPLSASFVYIFGVSALFLIPTLCMGGSFPLFSYMSKQYQTAISKLYFLNTLGAAIGCFVIVFLLIPKYGLHDLIWIIASINIIVGVIAILLSSKMKIINDIHFVAAVESKIQRSKLLLVFVTGFTIFTLEVAWFRSFISIFSNTTDIFASLLVCVLIALCKASYQIPNYKTKNNSLGVQLCKAGILILLVTPIVERLDYVLIYFKHLASANVYTGMPITISHSIAFLLYIFQTAIRFLIIYLIIVPPIQYLSLTFPWIMDDETCPRNIAKLYAVNTFAAVAGSLFAAWVFLPTFGFVKTAWLGGLFVLAAGFYHVKNTQRLLFIAGAFLAFLLALYFETGIGKTRVQGHFATDDFGRAVKILGYYEGPDATTSAIEYQDGTRALLINSALAAWESGKTHRASAHYMAWMGHLPMLLHPNPKDVLIICFGTGQTANAVRNENPQNIHIVDVNQHVFQLGHFFKSNENVLEDPRVKKIVMDGRAYLRRTTKTYDVITLEPMPPNTIGANNLYSREFYQFARNKLNMQGIIAQWLPFHIISSTYTSSIAKTFLSVFPNAILWIDPQSQTGILIGSKDNYTPLGTKWPGFTRNKSKRNLSNEEVIENVVLNSYQLKQFSRFGKIIADDNQLLAYGEVLYPSEPLIENFERLHQINPKINLPTLGPHFR